MPRMTLGMVSNTLIPQAIGCCLNDFATLAAFLNEAIQNLVNAGGETGWSFGWQRVVFNVDPDSPYIVCPREIVRLVNADVGRVPVRISNEWYEFLEYGPGLQNTCNCTNNLCRCGTAHIYDRGYFPPLEVAAGSYLRLYLTDVRDVGRRVLFSQSLDANGVRIYSQDGTAPVDGFYLVLDDPFVTSTFEVTAFGAILKDATYGEVILKSVDSTTSVETTIARFQPSETSPAYRKYFIQNMPRPCNGETTTQITALAKLEFIPLARETDFLLISNVNALRLECESIRFSRMDNPAFQQMSVMKHRLAVKALQNEQRHVYGSQTPSITQQLSGIESLRCRGIGYMT